MDWFRVSAVMSPHDSRDRAALDGLVLVFMWRVSDWRSGWVNRCRIVIRGGFAVIQA
jgi:hypothetical protein